jgi:hypothetical protein
MGSKKSGGRLRLTKVVHETIVKHLKAGAFKRHAAEAAGISDRALADWLKRGAAGEKPYAAFARDVQVAQAEDFIRNQAVISRAALIDRDWKAAAWNLERKSPTLYGRNQQPLLGVAVSQGGAGDESDNTDNGTKTRFEFYLPDNGRRPSTEDEDE